ncbi:dipeptide ABC transporter ATP-binding protein [Bosea thiooxidans]
MAPGEAYGLIGESGSGKSTIAFTVMRYAMGGRADGEIWLAGNDVMQMTEASLGQVRGRVAAMVYQDPMSALNPAIRIGEQVAEAVRLHRGLSRRAAADRARELLGKVHLPQPREIARRYPHQLSGGQQQRVVIAMALACDPQLLIMDEPTTSLDVTTEAVILDLVRELRRDTGVSVLFISHNIGVIAQVCDRVGVLYAGQLVEEGTTAEVLHAPSHPYTIGLMRAMPLPDRSQYRLATIPGRLPDMRHPPSGCVFAGRCAIAEEVCTVDMPGLVPSAGGDSDHRSRCHFREEAEDRIKPPVLVPHDVAEYTIAHPLLEAVGLRKRFGGGSIFFRGAPAVHAVADVSLAIPPGRTLAVVGESGSGKSTLARCVAGLIVPESGDIRLANHVLASRVGRRTPTQQRDVQFVFQNPDAALNPQWTVQQLLFRSLQIFSDLSGPALRRRAIELLETVNLGERYLARYPREMSGGEKQRVGIARAFAGNPRLVICDEPTSALDISVQAAILNELIALQVRHKTAYLFISHDLGVVRHMAHHVAIMRHGRIIEEGDPADVFNRPSHEYTRALIAAIPTLAPRPLSEARKVWGGE